MKAAHRRPPACHYDRQLRQRVTRRHLDDCDRDRCNGCQPCSKEHCLICGREHHAQTCPECEGKIAQDLADLVTAYDQVHDEAVSGGNGGRLLAAAPIPGGDASVVTGPTVRLELVRFSRTMHLDHNPKDPLPPLAILAEWEDQYRAWLGHDTTPRATVRGTVAYLVDQLPYIASHVTDEQAPDFVAFTRQVRSLRAGLEGLLHDERDPEQGVECFECGERLVRRFRPRQTCKHSTPAREHLAMRLTLLEPARGLLADLAAEREQRVPGWRFPTQAEYAASLPPSPQELAAARTPCPACAKTGQGGLDDPRAGHAWECPGCRKEYSVGEYVTAVRRDLASNTDSWTNVANAASAAATLCEQLLPGGTLSEKTIRGWVGRGWVRSRVEPVAGSVTPERPEGLPGVRLVFWPDVRQEAMRMAAGLHHCRHRTPARDWLRVLESYPELEPWAEELEDARVPCGRCADRVEAAFGTGVRRTSGRIGA